MLTGIKEINMLIFNYLNIEELKILRCVNNKINNEIKDVILKYRTCFLVIKTLSEIMNKNNKNESKHAEHLLLEMYYDMKKYNIQ